MSFSSSFPRRRTPAFATSCLAAGLLLAMTSPVQAATFTGSGALTTDYVWRGTTQTQGDPAVQAGFKAAADNGLYGAVWGSNVEFAPETKASSELDVSVGWGGNLAGDWALDVNLTHYRYPSTTVDLDWTEAIGTVTWKQNTWAQLGYSSDALASGEAGAYAQLGAKFPLSEQLRLEAAAGYYWLEDAYDDRYAHAQLGAVWAFKAPFELRVTAHATDRSAKTLFPGLAGSRVEAALQASF
nr:TorF family putative porin [uncultured Pseudoxanthomonas sp.]